MPTHRIVFEDAGWANLLPLVYWRSVGELRCGRRMLVERHFDASTPPGLWVRPELAAVVAERFPQSPVNLPAPGDAQTVLLINSRWLAGPERLPGDVSASPAVGVCGGQVAYLRLPVEQARSLDPAAFPPIDTSSPESWVARVGRAESADGEMVCYPWDLVRLNVDRMLRDWRELPAADGPAIQGDLYEGVHLLDRRNIRVGPGSSIKPCTVLDAEDGPIWIGANVRISPNCTIQGPVCIGDGTLIQPGAVIREGTTIGPVCKVGGEVEHSIIWGYSNKQHDGFLGHACLGSWINIAADSINSDLKNTYGPIRVPVNGVEIDSGQMFVGLTMGDHSKSSINSSFATGTVVGFCSNVVCTTFPPKFVPSFCWLTDTGRKQYDPARGLAVARMVMARRKVAMTPAEEALFLSIARRCREMEKSADLAPAEG